MVPKKKKKKKEGVSKMIKSWKKAIWKKPPESLLLFPRMDY